MRLTELVNTRQTDAQVEQAWDNWDAQIAADLKAGVFEAQIEQARAEAEAAEAL